MDSLEDIRNPEPSRIPCEHSLGLRFEWILDLVICQKDNHSPAGTRFFRGRFPLNTEQGACPHGQVRRTSNLAWQWTGPFKPCRNLVLRRTARVPFERSAKDGLAPGSKKRSPRIVLFLTLFLVGRVPLLR